MYRSRLGSNPRRRATRGCAHTLHRMDSSDDESLYDDDDACAYPVHDAVEAGDVELLSKLLGVSPDAPPAEPAEAEESGARAWRGGPDLNEKDDIDGCTPLQLAFMHGHVECAKLLIERGVGADVSRKLCGASASHMAVGLGAFRGLRDRCMPLLSLVLEKDDLTLKDDGGFVSVHIAAGLGLADCVEAILDKTENSLVEARDRLGARPMHHAARGSHVDVMALLLRRGASVDAANALGTTVLHTSVMHAQWDAVSFLMEHSANASAVDKRGLTAGRYATRRGLAPPPELRAKLATGDAGGAEASQPAAARRRTLLLTSETCMKHHTVAAPIRRGGGDIPPENALRLGVLCDANLGILRSSEFENVDWINDAPRAQLGDVLRVHEYSYVAKLEQLCRGLQGSETIGHVDPDTTISALSYEAAMHAAGAVCAAVDSVCTGRSRNAFCAVRPPGHHAGLRGVVVNDNDKEGSHGFCLLNNVAIGAAYTRHMYRDRGIQRVALIDFDVHHGNVSARSA